MDPLVDCILHHHKEGSDKIKVLIDILSETVSLSLQRGSH